MTGCPAASMNPGRSRSSIRPFGLSRLTPQWIVTEEPELVAEEIPPDACGSQQKDPAQYPEPSRASRPMDPCQWRFLLGWDADSTDRWAASAGVQT
jgi:hypothetical protein